MAESSPEQPQYPDLNTNGSSTGNTVQDTKNAVLSSEVDAQAMADNIKNSQTLQNIQNGPVAEKARAERDQTYNEFSNLAASRQTPAQQTATGQPLTHYHSAFYTLLSWQNPRATAISYVSIVLLIFAFRYVPITRYALRLTWITLGITAAAELAGKVVFEQGFASKLRPKKYYTIPRETLESSLQDVEELVNFFVLEAQRIVFAENVPVTVGAFATALLTYFLIRITPAWGLALLFTTLAYFLPLGYLSNKDLIDEHLNNASQIASDQTKQLRDIASQHTSKAVESTSAAVKTYTAQAQELIGQAKQKTVETGLQAKQAAVDKGLVSGETADKAHAQTEEALKSAPSAPSQEPTGANDKPLDTPLEPLAAQ